MTTFGGGSLGPASTGMAAEAAGGALVPSPALPSWRLKARLPPAEMRAFLLRRGEAGGGDSTAFQRWKASSAASDDTM
jgi:hypothetical protein